MSAPTAEAIAKLPKWAQEHIRLLSQQRDAAVTSLREWADHQTPQPFRAHEYVCVAPGSPTGFTRYIEGRRVDAEWAGVRVQVVLTEDGVTIYYECGRGSGRGHSVGIFPGSSNAFVLRRVIDSAPVSDTKTPKPDDATAHDENKDAKATGAQQP